MYTRVTSRYGEFFFHIYFLAGLLASRSSVDDHFSLSTFSGGKKGVDNGIAYMRCTLEGLRLFNISLW